MNFDSNHHLLILVVCVCHKQVLIYVDANAVISDRPLILRGQQQSWLKILEDISKHQEIVEHALVVVVFVLTSSFQGLFTIC